MALPTSAPTVTCTLSKPLLADGTVGTITSASLTVDRILVWSDTGETIYADPVPISVAVSGPTEGTIVFDVIPVDVVGMYDSGGNAIQNWTYTLRVMLTLAGGATRVVDYTFQPIESESTLDLDLIAQVGAVIIPPVVEGVVDGGAP